MKKITRRNFLRYSAEGIGCLTAAVHMPMLLPRTASGAVGSNVFNIAVISDTQNYCDNTKSQPSSKAYFIQQTQYIADHKDDMNIVFVSHVGDVVQHGDGTKGTGDVYYGAGAEWDRAVEAMDILEPTGIPFGLAIGNHDYDNYSYSSGSRPLKSTVMWKKYFGSDTYYFADKPWYGGASDDKSFDPGLSSYQTFAAGGKKFLHIALEMEAGDDAIAWAQQVVDAYPNYATIVTTHSYLNPPKKTDHSEPYVVPAERIKASYITNSPGGWNSAQDVWDKFLSKNAQIFLVLCGHAWNSADAGVSNSENIRIDDNDAGLPVYQVLSDYQGNTAAGSPGGDGWFRFMEFDMNTGKIHFVTYSTALDKYAGLNDEWNFNQPPLFSDFSLDVPAQVLDAAPQVDVVSSSFSYSRATKLYTGKLTLTNSSLTALTGTVGLALNDLTSGVTLTNATGTYNSAPAITVSSSGLAEGASIVVPVQFSDPSNAKIAFTPLVFNE